VIAVVHQVLWRRGLMCEEDRARDRHDALCIAAWMSRAFGDGSLAGFLKPQLAPAERMVVGSWACREGCNWGGAGRSDQAARAINSALPPTLRGGAIRGEPPASPPVPRSATETSGRGSGNG
jgi:hypothetical protein